MKMSLMRLGLFLTAVLFLAEWGAVAQVGNKSNSVSSDSQQVLRDILSEVHLLRVELLRASINIHRSQLVLDRVRTQQEQIIRLTHEISSVQEKLGEIRVQKQRKKVTDRAEQLY